MAPHPGMHVCRPVGDGPIPDLPGELTDELAATATGSPMKPRRMEVPFNSDRTPTPNSP